MNSDHAHSAISKLSISNTLLSKLLIRVEPWAEELYLEPGQKLDITFMGPEGGLIEFELGPEVVTIYGWEGSTFSIP
jgi:hypothetical protein